MENVKSTAEIIDNNPNYNKYRADTKPLTAFEIELDKQGFEPKTHIDDKTGEKFIGWSINHNK